jgi:hypothetical protein
MFVASFVAMCVSGALLAYAGFGSHARLFRRAALAGGLCSLLLVTPTILGFSTN